MTVSQELRTGVRCVVTRPSKHGEFKKGDVIWLDVDGAIMSAWAAVATRAARMMARMVSP